MAYSRARSGDSESCRIGRAVYRPRPEPLIRAEREKIMSKWFVETFLPSLFARCGAEKNLWLSVKQTNICLDNMDRHTSSYQGDQIGTQYHHNWYSCMWDGRKVTLDYSKLNGCGCIKFGFNAEEMEENRIRAEAERASQAAAHIAFIKRKPERLERKLRNIDNAIAQHQKALNDELENPDEDSEDYITYYREQIEKLTAERVLYA